MLLVICFSQNVLAKDARLKRLIAAKKIILELSSERDSYFLKEKIILSASALYKSDIKLEMEIIDISFDAGISTQESRRSIYDSRDIDGVSYQEISQDFQIYPTEEGRLEVGPVTVLLKLDYKGESFEDYATIDSFSFDSIAKDKAYSFSSDDVSLEVKVFKGDELIEKKKSLIGEMFLSTV